MVSLVDLSFSYPLKRVLKGNLHHLHHLHRHLRSIRLLSFREVATVTIPKELEDLVWALKVCCSLLVEEVG